MPRANEVIIRMEVSGEVMKALASRPANPGLCFIPLVFPSVAFFFWSDIFPPLT